MTLNDDEIVLFRKRLQDEADQADADHSLPWWYRQNVIDRVQSLTVLYLASFRAAKREGFAVEIDLACYSRMESRRLGLLIGHMEQDRCDRLDYPSIDL